MVFVHYLTLINPKICKYLFYPMLADLRKSVTVERFQALAVCPGNRNVLMKMNTEHWWKEPYTDGGKAKYSEKLLSPCHFFLQKFYMDWLELEPEPPWRDAGV